MHYWRKGYVDTLNAIRTSLAQFPEWHLYAQYCAAQGKGLRKAAFSILQSFISDLEQATFKDRRRFVSWLLGQAYRREGHELLVPWQLKTRIIDPTLDEWLVREPLSNEVHRWLGGYEHLKRALQLGQPDDNI